MPRHRPIARTVLAWLIAAGGAAAIVGFVLYAYLAYNAGRAELRALCERDFAPKVYRRVSAEGYFDGGVTCIADGCWEVLLESRYRYIEFEKRKVRYGDPISETGFYRVSRSSIAKGDCDPDILEDMAKRFKSRDFVAAGHCLRLDKVKEPIKGYGIFWSSLPILNLDNQFGSEIRSVRFVIKDLTEQTLVAEQTSYMLLQNSIPSFGGVPSLLHCETESSNTGQLSHVSDVEEYITPI